MKKFEILDFAGDVGIRAFGSNLKEIFSNAATGMYSLITDLSRIQEVKAVETINESHSTEGLLVSWLNELIFHFDAYGFVGKAIDIIELKDNRIRAVITGEHFDPEQHEGKLLIKAATYHKLRIKRKDDLWEADVVFDI